MLPSSSNSHWQCKLPETEINRLQALCQYQILDTVPEAHFDNITRLVAYICQTPIAAISLVDAQRQWYKSKMGFMATEEPCDITFCAYTIRQAELLVIPDTLADERFATNPFVVGDARIRFYAGAPLIAPNGFTLGTLCVLDHVPRELSCEQIQFIRVLADQVVAQLELRRNLKNLKQSIIERQKSEAKLRHHVFHDELTGLPNRALFMKQLKSAILQTKWNADYLFAVLFMDLDRFKVVNDSLGHMVGDQLLIATARRLKACLRPEDMVARLGGDEFVILLDNIKGISDATDVAERIQARLSLPSSLSGHEVFTSISIGIALGTTAYHQPEDLLRDADTAMYRAKVLGKARYEVFDIEMHDSVVKLMQLENDLRRAIERQEFQIYYQPIVLVDTGRITGFEALIRWQHPTRGLLNPVDFISVAEETGAIVPIGYWVLSEACRQLHTWQLEFSAQPLTISVNLSSKQFSQPDLVEQIIHILHSTNLDPRSLKLEITESTIMENAESATAMLLRLRDLGIEIYLDDFGTGYSSLSSLHRFPVDVLKIDRSFINTIQTNHEKPKIVQVIMTLAQNLGMDAIAEGIETVEQRNQLKTLQCRYGQGYLFYQPVDKQTAAAIIAQDRQ
ncbi:putative bifunctional diguanylate cyclase/phosphodiesterase [Gloeocapsopsis dulcis]|uniref:GGDEF domain-containing protein n=1 Tax=Gloeocapsopsis dulcis AAB1 = 1H9 TaxID=1433147 RepID=A0A6N8FTI6_9CHRO|nr:EAL domain-containing protein [Gloeocapsopsis dulcis]MUL35892.1 GGDEF domain-containing protein [Gloeocapsopsis dulcis AAB1 = 1H9]WNN87639.1 EAL domain-containing protein [Gloeocapsopsis dulcis]